jgi:hypothetical protein
LEAIGRRRDAANQIAEIAPVQNELQDARLSLRLEQGNTSSAAATASARGSDARTARASRLGYGDSRSDSTRAGRTCADSEDPRPAAVCRERTHGLRRTHQQHLCQRPRRHRRPGRPVERRTTLLCMNLASFAAAFVINCNQLSTSHIHRYTRPLPDLVDREALLPPPAYPGKYSKYRDRRTRRSAS